MTRDPAGPDVAPGDVSDRADRLKERVYVTFKALAVVLALRGHDETSTEAARSLVVVVAGSLLASAAADVISHTALHSELPSRAEVLRIAHVSGAAAYALVLPAAFLVLAVAEVWSVDQALRASSMALIATLIAVGYLAARRARLPLRYRMLVLFAEFAVGVLVVFLELLAH